MSVRGARWQTWWRTSESIDRALAARRPRGAARRDADPRRRHRAVRDPRGRAAARRRGRGVRPRRRIRARSTSTCAASSSVLPAEVVDVPRRSARAPGEARRPASSASQLAAASLVAVISARSSARALIDCAQPRLSRARAAPAARQGSPLSLAMALGDAGRPDAAVRRGRRAARRSSRRSTCTASRPRAHGLRWPALLGARVRRAARAVSLRAVAAPARHRAPRLARRRARRRCCSCSCRGRCRCGSSASPRTSVLRRVRQRDRRSCCGSTCRR